ncbi:hypothetical protein BU24DRAFT_417715 [Aaosphaeria arxii CBS 175.79]|uniref:Uncharacterized protein n=1 Tax=Aaosphaeria arxii CBS 175.79 TaxID=1450172 RepID=A0A6A5YBL3_9PLEO|nr:uncharacterized protein BU24DRAFT_417715 [Aaosphaeria arxii CBS 175.79]KAF2022070.1 hypothetical protein BU24DRAFT_417715 [Aaosphaeria arxii CBS 175.79]
MGYSRLTGTQQDTLKRGWPRQALSSFTLSVVHECCWHVACCVLYAQPPVELRIPVSLSTRGGSQSIHLERPIFENPGPGLSSFACIVPARSLQSFWVSHIQLHALPESQANTLRHGKKSNLGQVDRSGAPRNEHLPAKGQRGSIHEVKENNTGTANGGWASLLGSAAQMKRLSPARRGSLLPTLKDEHSAASTAGVHDSEKGWGHMEGRVDRNQHTKTPHDSRQRVQRLHAITIIH